MNRIEKSMVALDAAIEKAVTWRGQRMSRAERRRQSGLRAGLNGGKRVGLKTQSDIASRLSQAKAGGQALRSSGIARVAGQHYRRTGGWVVGGNREQTLATVRNTAASRRRAEYRFRKSFAALSEAIEKAGLRLGGVRVSPAQRRALAMRSGGAHKPHTWNQARSMSSGRSAYRGSKHKLSSEAKFLRPSGRISNEPTQSQTLSRILRQNRAGSKTARIFMDAARERIHGAKTARLFMDASLPSLPRYKRTMFGGLKRIRKAGRYVTLEAIEKAGMRFADGSLRRVSRRQKREIKTQNGVDANLRAGGGAGRTKNSQSPSHQVNRQSTPGYRKLIALRNRNGTRFKYNSTDRSDRKVQGAWRAQTGHIRNRVARLHFNRFRKAKAKTLYVYRPVENADAIIAWAKSQGFKTTLAPDDMHVTLAFSKTPMNWARLSDDYRLDAPASDSSGLGGQVHWSQDGATTRKIAGGVREVQTLGDDGAVVLAFESITLTERWADFRRVGASWDYPSFTAHITLTYDGDGVDLEKVSPYTGEIVLGEECWEEIDEDADAEEEAA